jgi:histone deacetylase complex regulatory component SIN3
VLFADDPDLLRELANFMPDSAKDEAVAWSNRAALKAEMRRAALLIDFSRGNSHTANARSSSSSPLPSGASSSRDDASMETD